MRNGIPTTETDILYGEPYAYSGTYDNSNGYSEPYSYNGNEAYGGTFANTQVYTVPDGAFFFAKECEKTLAHREYLCYI